MIKAVLFDMNGIIIDDEHIHELAFHETVKPFDIQLSHQDYLDCCAGKTDRAGYESIATTFNKQLPVDSLLQQKSQTYLKLFPANKKDYPGVIELIHILSRKYLLSVTSSSSRAEVDLITKEFGMDKALNITISADDVKKGKPDPEPYLITCEKLGINPHEAVVIEDSQSGVASAKAAGCFCIGVTTTHSVEDLQQSDLIVDSFAKITPEIIENLTI